MITYKAQIILIAALIVYFLILLKMLREHITLLKYTLLWILLGVVLAVFAIFPRLLQSIASLFGIYADTNFLFSAIILFLIIISFSLTHIVSRLNNVCKELVQQIALLEKRIRDLESKDENKN